MGNRTLVWEKKNLPGTDVQVAPAGTNPTGSLRLVQAKFMVNGQLIDWTTYFRNTVFGNQPWVPQPNQRTPREIVTIHFNVRLKGKALGVIPLALRHKPSGEAGQHNFTTALSWGLLADTIAQAGLTGGTIRLYHTPGAQPEFEIELR